jgi:hypothetical protein
MPASYQRTPNDVAATQRNKFSFIQFMPLIFDFIVMTEYDHTIDALLQALSLVGFLLSVSANAPLY